MCKSVTKSAQAFAAAVETVEDVWLNERNEAERSRHLDASIMAAALAESRVTHVRMPSEVTVYVNPGWQDNAFTRVRIGATTANPPCLIRCTSALEELIAAMASTPAPCASTIAIDAVRGKTLLMDQSHVHAIVRNGDAIQVLEPTCKAPWMDSFDKFYRQELHALCAKHGLQYHGYCEGDRYDHFGLCRYKVAFDCQGQSVDVQDFRRQVKALPQIMLQ